jgi:hypothetical protein
LITFIYWDPKHRADLSGLPSSVLQFLEQINFREKLLKAEQNSASRTQLIKRLFHWFDNLQVLKYVHFARDFFYPNIEVGEAAKILLQELGVGTSRGTNLELLNCWRQLDRK